MNLKRFSARFETKGFIQVCFLWCEVSKGIADIFTNKGVKYVPHVGYVEKPCVTNRFDPDLHDTQLLWKKIDAQISALFERLPEARSILEGCLHARD